MSIMDSNMLIYVILAIIVILIAVSIVKKAVKVIIFLLMIFILFFAYNVFIKGASPVEEAKGYVSDVKYGKNIAQYSSKIKISVDNMEKIISAKNYDTSTVEILKTESANLNKLYGEIKILEHREKFNSFHENYCSYVKNIVDSTTIITKLGSISSEENYEKLEEAIKKVKVDFEELPKIKNIAKVKEFISTSIKND